MALIFNGAYGRAIGRFLGTNLQTDEVWSRLSPIISEIEGSPYTATYGTYGYLLPDQFAIVSEQTPEQPNRINYAIAAIAVMSAGFFGPPYVPPAVTIPNITEAVYPDVLNRPQFLAAEQQAYAGPVLPPVIAVAPNITSSVYPDWLDRRLSLASEQQAYAGLGKPEQPLPEPSSVYPAWVDRRTYAASEQLVEPVEPPKPEETIVEPSSVYPAWLDRRLFSASEQQAFAGLGKPEQPLPLASSTYPAWIDRRTYTAAEQLVEPVEPPKPEEKIQEPSSVYPAWLDRRQFLAAEQQAFVGLGKPEQTLPEPSSVYPAWLDRRQFLAGTQQAFAGPLSPLVPVFFEGNYPDVIERVSFSAAEQQAFAGPLSPLVPVFFEGNYPDVIERVSFSAAEQQAFAGPLLPPVTVVPTFFEGSYPDQVRDASFLVATQLAFTTEVIPIPNPPAPPSNVPPTQGGRPRWQREARQQRHEEEAEAAIGIVLGDDTDSGPSLVQMYVSEVIVEKVERGNLVHLLANFGGDPTEVHFIYTAPGSEKPIVDVGYGNPGSKITRIDEGQYAVTIDTSPYPDGGVFDWHFFGEGENQASDYGAFTVPKRKPQLL